MQFSRFAQTGRFTVFVYNKSWWNFPSMPDACTVRFAKLKSGLDGRPPCDDQMDLIVYVCLITNKGPTKRLRLLHTNFIGSSEQLSYQSPFCCWDAQIILLDLVTSSTNSVIPSSYGRSLESMAMWSSFELRFSAGVKKFTIYFLLFFLNL